MLILEKIDALRRERGWSVNNLAMEAMLTQSTLNNLYMRKAEPKISTLRAICGAFGITLAEFFAEDAEAFNGIDAELKRRVCALNVEQKKRTFNAVALCKVLIAIKNRGGRKFVRRGKFYFKEISFSIRRYPSLR